MKKNDFVQIKGLDIKELILKAKALKIEIADLTIDKNMKKMKDLKIISKKRKDLAQILTVASQKELLAKLESKSLNVSKIKENDVKSVEVIKDKKGDETKKSK